MKLSAYIYTCKHNYEWFSWLSLVKYYMSIACHPYIKESILTPCIMHGYQLYMPEVLQIRGKLQQCMFSQFVVCWIWQVVSWMYSYRSILCFQDLLIHKQLHKRMLTLSSYIYIIRRVNECEQENGSHAYAYSCLHGEYPFIYGENTCIQLHQII